MFVRGRQHLDQGHCHEGPGGEAAGHEERVYFVMRSWEIYLNLVKSLFSDKFGSN